jgi:hypothetical protein
MSLAAGLVAAVLFLEVRMEHNEKCGECANIIKQECGGSYFFYCSVRTSGRTENGLLKVKCKNTACFAFRKRQHAEKG